MHLLPAALAAIVTLAAASALAADAPPRLTSIGCNYDGGPSWLAVGRATVAPEGGEFRVEVPGFDLDRVEAQISPSSLHAFTPYAGPLVSPLIVAGTAVAPRQVGGVVNGNVIIVRFSVVAPDFAAAELQQAGAIAYVLVLNGKPSGCVRDR